MSNPDRLLPPAVSALLAVVGIVLIVIAVVYFAEPAGSLPGFFPGRQAGSSHHHTTHGIAALVVGLVALVGSWMGAGRKRA